MLYNPPTGAQNANDGYTGKNLAAGQQGSRIPPMAVEAPQREIVATIAEALFSPTNSDLRQLLKAIRSGRLTTFDDTGIVNHLVVTPQTPHTELFKGLPFRIWPAATNTGPAYLRVSQLAELPILRRDGSALQPGDLAYGALVEVAHDVLGHFRLTSLAHSEVPRIVASLTLWVRPDGNDLNDGSANDAAHAFLTIDRALAVSANIITTSGGKLIRLGQPGTYLAPALVNRPGDNIQIQGDATNQAGFVVAGAGTAFAPTAMVYGCALRLSGLTLQNTAAVGPVLGCSNGSQVTVDHVTLTAANGNTYTHFAVYGTGSLAIEAGVVLASSMGGWLSVDKGAVNFASGVTITMAGSPNWSVAGVQVTSGGSVGVVSTPAVFSGAATGQRFSVTSNGVINSGFSGPNWLPGSAAGVADNANGGRYVA